MPFISGIKSLPLLKFSGDRLVQNAIPIHILGIFNYSDRSRMKRKQKIIIAIVALLFLLAAGGTWFLNPILEKSLDRYAREQIKILQQNPTYAFTYEELDLNIMQERITLHNFTMKPLEEFEAAFLKGENEVSSIKQLAVNEVTIEGVGLINFLWDKSIKISAIRIDSVTLDLLLSGRVKKTRKKENKGKGLSLEGIRLPGIQALTLGSFELGSFTLHQMDLEPRDTLLSFTSAGGRLEGLKMKKASNVEGSVFEPELEDLTLYLDEEKLDLRKNLYSMGFEQLKYSFASQSLDIKTLSFQPREELETFRKKNTHSFEIYSATLKELKLVNFDLDGFLNNGSVSVAKMELDSLNLEIFRDKTKPFDTSRRVKLLNQKMVALDFPFTVDSIEVRDSYLEYIELSEAGKDPLVLDFSDLNINLTNLTSITEGLPDSQPLELEVKGKLDGAIPVDVKIRLPYNTNTFTASGHTEGTSDFSSLNKTVLPAVGLQFKTGRLDGLRFDIRGTPWSLGGNLTLLYHNLEVELHGENQEKRKTLSWAANALLKKSNPKPNGHTVVGEIQVDRIPYKGLGNYLWKGVESGLINSLNPLGKHKVVRK
jgi:hypothetical protein